MFPFPAAMMMQGLGGGAAAGLRPQDVFRATTFDAGDGVNIAGPDMLTYGGTSWLKSKGGSDQFLFTSAMGDDFWLNPNQSSNTQTAAPGYFSRQTTGVRMEQLIYGGTSSSIALLFRQADKFHKTGIFTHASATADTFDMSSLGIVGTVIIRRRNAAGAWYVWHRNLSAGNNLRLSPAAQSTADPFISVSGTTVTFSSLAAAGTYIIEAWAHDPATSGIIRCDSYPGGDATKVLLGWRPQLVMFKNIASPGPWGAIYNNGSNLEYIIANNSQAADDATIYMTFDSDGFTINSDSFGGASSKAIFLAVAAPIT